MIFGAICTVEFLPCFFAGCLAVWPCTKYALGRIFTVSKNMVSNLLAVEALFNLWMVFEVLKSWFTSEMHLIQEYTLFQQLLLLLF